MMQGRHQSSMENIVEMPNRKTISLAMPAAHLQYLDDRARYEACTRAAYIRRLIVRDMEAQQHRKDAAA
jgi:hypothetical protein